MIALLVISSVYVFWLLYLGACALYRAKKEKVLSKSALVISLPIILSVVIIDFLMNYSLFTLFFWELPKEALVTDRLTRHIKEINPSWRKTLATWICNNLLNPFDPSGTHCK